MGIVKSFRAFLNESIVNEAAGEDNKTIVFLSGKASATKLGEEVAKQLGIKKDVIYTVELPSFGTLAFIANKESGPGGNFTLGAEKNNKIKITDTGKKSAGKDVLIINGKEIKDGKGIISFEKDEVLGKSLTITASNNGFLAMVRLGSAMVQCAAKSRDLVKPSGLSWFNATNSSLELGLGGNPKDESSREGTFAYAISSSYKPTYNAMKQIISLCIAKSAAPLNQPDELTFPDYKEENWTTGLLKRTKGVTDKEEIYKIAGEYLDKSINALRGFRLKSNDLINDQEIKASDLWLNYASKMNKYASKKRVGSGEKSREMVTLTPEGAIEARKLHNELAKRLAPSKLPEQFKASENLLKTAKEIVTYACEFPEKGDYNAPLENCQSKHTFGPAGSLPGSVGSGETKYKEGKF
jgi:hypothetical protein